MKNEFDLLHDYIIKKQEQKAAGKEVNTDNPEGLVNGIINTNIGLFRAYMTMYLMKNPVINQE